MFKISSQKVTLCHREVCLHQLDYCKQTNKKKQTHECIGQWWLSG